PLHDLLAGWGRSSVAVWKLLLVPLVGTGKLDDLGVRDADDVEVAVKVEYLGIHRDLALALRLRFDGRGPVETEAEGRRLRARGAATSRVAGCYLRSSAAQAGT